METNSTNIDWEAELASLLAELSRVQEDLLDVLVQKRSLMIKSDVDGMSQLQPREEVLVQRLQACHDRRARLLEQAAGQGLPSTSIGQLAATIPDGQGERLGKRAKELSSRMRLLQHHSLASWVFAQRSLLHLSQLLEIIATGGRLQPTYGKSQSALSCGSLVDREV